MKNEIISGIIDLEGGYVNDSDDSGGETNWGVTKRTARLNGYDGAMIDLSYCEAYRILCAQYWDKVRADDLVVLSKPIAREVVDTGVNMGTHRAVKFLQRSLNLFTSCNLAIDGVMGRKTLTALRLYLERRDETVLVKALNCLQGSYYVKLAETREKDRKFVYGWFNKRI